MPLTPKGKKISKTMNKFYGKKKAQQVFNDMVKEGKLTGVGEKGKKK